MTTAKLFKLGNAQAVRIPARYRFDVEEVEVFQRGAELILRPKLKTAADVFAAIRAQYGPVDIQRPQQGELEPVEPLDI